MYLPPTERKMLYYMKKAQKREGQFVAISDDSLTLAYTTGYYLSDVAKALASTEAIHLKMHEESAEAALEALIDKDLVERLSSGACQVTHSGWFNRHIRCYEVVKAIITHFIFPAAVAFVTTMITLLLK